MRVAVVGAGIIGLGVADELTRRGIQVELFEKLDSPALESSWAAAGILSPQGEAKGPGVFLDLAMAGYRLIPEMAERLTKTTGIHLHDERCGMLEVAFSEADQSGLEKEALWQRAAGLTGEFLTQAQVRKMEPLVDESVRCGIFWPETIRLDVRELGRAYAAAVCAQGASLHTECPVARFLVKGSRVVGVQTPRGEFFADWVVNAAGSWAGFDDLLSFPIPTMPVRGQILQFRTEKAWFERVVKSPRVYFVQRTPAMLLAGTTLEYAGFDKAVTAQGTGQILEGASQISSRIQTLSIETAWAGLRPGTPDGLPILGATPMEHLLMATGHFRNGILLAPLTGQLIAEWITQGRCSRDLSAFGMDRFLTKSVLS